MSNEEKDIDSEVLELSAQLTKAEKKKINNQIADERVEQDGTVRKLGNIAERAVSILSGAGNNIPYVSSIDDKRFIELAKKELDNRKGNYMGGYQKRKGLAKGSLLEDDMPTHTMPDGTVMPGATHEDYEMMMDEPASLPEEQEQDMLPETSMESDETMEDEYLDFILDEALDEEEEIFLMNQLEANERLSIIFDKVVDVAQEFAGSGPVEGPGSGVSDSIPARLSDGEFVFTAKAVDEIGADNLMAMMKDAEIKADDRQGLADGGKPEEERIVLPVEEQKEPQVRIVKETVDNGGKGLTDEDEISAAVKQKLLLDNLRGRHVQS